MLILQYVIIILGHYTVILTYTPQAWIQNFFPKKAGGGRNILGEILISIQVTKVYKYIHTTT